MSVKLFEFSEQNADPWFKRLPSEEQAKFKSAVNRLNASIQAAAQHGLPQHYQGISKRLNANPSILTDEQIYAVDQTIVKTLYQQDTFAQIMSNRGITAAANQWEQKIYALDEDSVFPKQGIKSFRNLPLFTLGVEPSMQSGIGTGISYEINWEEIELAQGGLYSPDMYYALVAAERMGIVLDEAGFWGTGSPHGLNQGTAAVEGIANHSSIGSFSATGLTTYKGVYTALLNAASYEKNVFQGGSTIVISTSGIASQTLTNVSSYDHTEYELIRDNIFGRGLIDEWWVTERLYRSTSDPSTSQQAMMVIKLGPTLQKNKIVYPLQTKSMLDKKFTEDIKEALIYGNTFVQYGVQKHPAAIATGLTTSGTGFVKNGRFM